MRGVPVRRGPARRNYAAFVVLAFSGPCFLRGRGFGAEALGYLYSAADWRRCTESAMWAHTMVARTCAAAEVACRPSPPRHARLPGSGAFRFLTLILYTLLPGCLPSRAGQLTEQ